MGTLEQTLLDGEAVLIKPNGTFLILPREDIHPASKGACVDMCIDLKGAVAPFRVFVRQFSKFDLIELANNLLRTAEKM